MKVVVTGAGSRLGRAVIPQLCQCAEVSEVVGIGRKHFPSYSHSKLSVHQSDVRSPSLAQIFEGAHAVVHMAFAVTQRTMTPEQMYDNNVNGSRNVFRAARSAGVEKIVNLSSVGIYGEGHRLVETAAFAPSHRWPYACHKAEVEEMLSTEFNDICSVQLRSTYILGPNVIPVLRKLFTSRIYVRPRRPHPSFQVIHEDDVASAVVAALDPQVSSDAFNLAAPESVTMPELVRNSRWFVIGIPVAAIEALHGAGGGNVRLIDTTLELIRASLTVNTERARTVLGWIPRFSAWDARAACDRNLSGNQRRT